MPSRTSALAWVALGVMVAASGCTDGLQSGDTVACPATSQRATLTEVYGTDLTVRLPDGQVAVLHAAQAHLYRKDPDGCVGIAAGDLTVGSNVGFTVDQWAESYPMQGWPGAVVLNA